MAYILKTDTIIDITYQLRKQGKTIIFTHGTFDLFHTGHSYVIETSKKKGDVLIVGVEPNKNIQQYKASGRPILDERERTELVAAHRATDFVFLIDTLERVESAYYPALYQRIKPNTVTFGANFGYTKRMDEKIRGIKYIKLDKLIQDPRMCHINSTTEIIKKIKRLK